MKIIAHRANIGGPSNNNENRICSIKNCISLGFDVEIDIRMIDKELYLGHDFGENIINIRELKTIKNNLWIHCKNIESITFFNEIDEDFNYFWHEDDSYTLTSKGFIWAFPGEALSNRCICVMPELQHSLNDLKSIKSANIAGICTDYPDLFI